MLNKKIILFIMLIITLFTVSTVYSSEVDSQRDISFNDELIEDNVKIFEKNATLTHDENNLSSTEIFTGTKFSELESKINSLNNGDVISLTNNVTQDGSSQINISKSITINGNGVTIDAQGKSRIFYINEGSTVFLNNITFTNGYHNESGGAIYFNGLGKVENCNFSNIVSQKGALFFSNQGTVTNSNFINNTGSNGGAICFVNYGEVTKCNFINNTAKNASAINMFSGIVADCNFINNKATENHAGAIWVDSGNLTGCNFISNTANLSAGAIWVDSGNVVGCNFIDNTANLSAGGILMGSGSVEFCNFTNNKAIEYHGGAIRMSSGSVEFCNFKDNFATSMGGAIYFTEEGNANVNKCNFKNNTASNGGAIYFDGDFNGEVLSCNFTSNHAYEWGGAVFVYSEVNVTGCNFANNSAELGGAISFDLGSVNECNFVNNTAINGSAVYFYIGGKVSNSNFTKNNATECGGAIFAVNNINILNSVFKNNSANNSGGAVYFEDIFSDSKINSTFINNKAYNGGAIYFKSTITNISVNSYFNGNNALRAGGAIFVRGQSINNNFSAEFYNNHADNASGGAIFFNNLVENNRFENIFKTNYALYGGAIFFYNKANDNEFKSEFINNTAKSCGGAIFFYNITNRNNFSGCFINNSALGEVDPTVGNGGAITFKDTSTNNIFTCDFINNTANLNGGGVNYRQTPYNITFNSNFINNTSPSGGGVNFFESFENVIFNGEFIGNSARNGGAIAACDGSISDVSFRDNIAVIGGAIYFNGTGEVSKCIFTNNEAVADYDGGGAIFMISGNATGSVFTANRASGAGSMGGAVLIKNSGNVTNCRFEDNSAEFGGAVASDMTVDVADCNFTANRASVQGGAFYIGSCNIENSNFTNNIASDEDGSGNGGAVYITDNASVVNCDFIGNEAYEGSAIYFWNLRESKHVRSISHSTFLNNKANMDSITPFTLTVNGTNIEIVFNGNNNLLNAILSRMKMDVNVTNVTYWGASGIENTGDSTTVPVMLYAQAGQNVTVRGVVDGVEVNIVRVTDAEGKIVLENVGEYNITVSHDEDSYYTSAKTFFTSKQLNLNVTDITTNDLTVNITAKSDILGEIMSGEMVFMVDGESIYASYAGNGTWWAMHTFDDFGTYKVGASFSGPYNVSIRNGTINVNKLKTEITGSAITATYNVNKNLVITLKDSTGKVLSGVKVTVNLNGAKTYTTDKNGQVKVSTKGFAPKKYIAKVTFNGDAVYDKSAKNIKVTVKKATPKLIAKKKTFKRSVKVKKYSIILKNNVGKVIKNAKVTIKIGKKIFKAKTNSKGKATFKIMKLTKKGNYNAKLSFNSNKYYNKVNKKVKIRIR